MSGRSSQTRREHGDALTLGMASGTALSGQASWPSVDSPETWREVLDHFGRSSPNEAGKTFATSQIGARTGLIVIAIENGGDTITNPLPATPLESGCRLLMLGTTEQRAAFVSAFE